MSSEQSAILNFSLADVLGLANLQKFKNALNEELRVIIHREFGVELTTQDVVFSNPQQEKQGDFSTPISLRLGKQLGQAPLKIAEFLAERIRELELKELDRVEVLAPGFVNFFLSEEFLIKSVVNEEESEGSGASVSGETRQKVIVDYSSPNIAKPLGIHHILSTVIGQTVVNLHRFTGQEVVAWNYLGDWGTQFGKLIYAFKQWGNFEQVEKNPIPELLALYVEFHNRAEAEEGLEEKGREEFRKLEEGDIENRKLWQWVVDLSKKDLERVYEKLGGISFDVYSGEADREEDLPGILSHGVESGVFVEGENGALVVDLEEEGMIPFLVRKSDGATLYSTRDIASVKIRTGEEYEGDKLIYVVDIAQALHFKQLFATVKKFDWFKEETDLVHLKFGRMSFKDGKMSTRKGNIIQLEELLDEAFERAKSIILEKNPELENLDKVAWQVGVGSVKYSILSQSPETNIVFDWDKIISFEGNSAPYLQYSCARAKSVLRQAGDVDFEGVGGVKLEEIETKLMKCMLKFPDVVEEACYKLRPNVLANYLFELCQLFNSFYGNLPILNSEDVETRNMRLKLVSRFAKLTQTGLNLLGGIEVPEKM